MPADTEQPGDDEQGERPRRRRSRDDDDSSHEQAVKAGLNVFSRKPMETMMAIIVLGVGAQMYFNNQQQAAREAADAARYDKIVAERKEEREHDAREREKDRGAAEKRLQEVLASGKDQNQRLVDHLKFLSDAVAKMTNQQTLNFGYDRTGIVGEVAKKLLDPKVKSNELHTGTMRGTGSPVVGSAGGESGDRSGADSATGGVDFEPDRD